MPMASKFERACGGDRDAGLLGARHLGIFLACKVLESDFDDRKLAPSPTIEKCWKLLVLHPKVYGQVCGSLGGPLIDFNDDRYAEFDESQVEAEKEKRRRNTRAAATRHFYLVGSGLDRFCDAAR